MRNLIATRKKSLAIFLTVLLGFTLMGAACTSQDYEDRVDQQDSVTLENSLGKQAQQERLDREEDTSTVRYVYVLPYGSAQIIGYYVINGGVYDASTQLAPEQEIICKYNTSESCQAVDSARDNGTYGGDDGGVFFFTTDGVLIETNLAYIQSDQLIPIDVPRLTGAE